MVMIKSGIVYGILRISIMNAGINKAASRYPKTTYQRIRRRDMIYFVGPAWADGSSKH